MSTCSTFGEADAVRDRVDQHLKIKDLRTGVVAFTSKDNNLNKAHVRFLGALLLKLAGAADRVALQNSTAPPLPRLSEAVQADMNGYLDELLVILPLLGITAFEALGRQVAPADRLFLSGKDAQATGADMAEGFVVFEGSLARVGTVPSIHQYLADLRH